MRMHSGIILFLLLSLIFPSLKANAQSNPGCEQIALKSQEEIVALQPSDNGKVREILRRWKESCGNSEPIQRISILMDIREGKLSDSISNEYLASQAYQVFISRVQFEGEADYLRIYEESKNYFGHAPLRSDLDSWTIDLAQKNRRYTDSGSKERAYSEFFAGDIDALDQLKNSYNKKYVFDPEAAAFLEIGSWMPLGKLSDRFKRSFNLGVGVGGNINRKYRLSLLADYTVLSKHPDFDVKIGGDTLTTNSDGIFTIGGRFARRFRPTENQVIDLMTGLSYSRMDTDVMRDAEDSTYYGIQSFSIPLGFNFLSKIKDGPMVGIYLGYQYTPFINDKRLFSHFGVHSMCIKATIFFSDLDD